MQIEHSSHFGSGRVWVEIFGAGRVRVRVASSATGMGRVAEMVDSHNLIRVKIACTTGCSLPTRGLGRSFTGMV